jgi:hypothetical protein
MFFIWVPYKQLVHRVAACKTSYCCM